MITLTLVLMGFYPHMAGRPAWYSSVYTCSENETISESYNPLLEHAVTQAVKDYMSHLSQVHPYQTMKRGQHARSIACLRANFKVLDDIPAEYRHGVFSSPETFSAWVRLSPGQSDIQTDREAHARGFAIKLTGVPGAKLSSEEQMTQDFILLNSPVFFTGDNHDYMKLIPNMDNLLGILDWKMATYKLISMMVYVAKLLSWSDNPLTHSFYSTTPYLLGNETAVKYMVRPCRPIAIEYVQGPSQMRAAIRATLDPASGQDVCYNFYVQKRIDPCTEPIEDPTIPWNTEMVHLAQLTIPKQNFMFEDQFEFCEALSFNPWHSLEAHRPLGAINHVRRLVYEESKQLRSESASYAPIEPSGNEKFGKYPIGDINFDMTTMIEPAGDTKHYQFQAYAENASDSDLVSIPSHVRGLPPGEEFEVSTFLALLMRMFVGDHKVEEQLTYELEDSQFKEFELEGFLTGVTSFASTKLSERALVQRLKQQMGIVAKVNDVDATMANARMKALSWIVKVFKRPNRLPESQDFATAIDSITTIFKRTSRAVISDFKDPQEYEQLFSRAFATDMPWVVEDGKWRRDEVFANQFIRGVNPTWIRRMSRERFPTQLNLDETHIATIEEHIRRLRPAHQGETFQSVINDGEIFFAEYSMLNGLHRTYDAFLHEPVILFTLTTHENPIERQLLPLAIQLEDGRTFYPPTQFDCLDRKNFDEQECLIWLFAKIHLMSADANIHESFVHLGMTHLMIEPIVVAARREFAPTHPIFRTLAPHFHQTIAINNEGRDTLINPVGIFQRTTGLGIKGTLQLINRGFERLNFTEWTFPKRMEAVGFPDVPSKDRLTKADTLPGYLYRDFCYDLWYANLRYITEVVDTIYHDEAQMHADRQLQGFAFEVSSPRFGNIPTFPSHFTSKAQLAEALTTITFTASVMHSAVNFGQFDAYGFIPNRPLAVSRPMPQDLSKLTMKYILSSLPNKDRAFGQMAVTFALSIPPEDTGHVIPLEWASQNSHSLSPAPKAFKRLIDEYSHLKEKMRQVCQAGNWGYYNYVFPDRLAVSIAI
jgi:hypothetical protein